MKIRNNLMVITALCFAILILGACSYWNSPDEQGSIRINFENSGARYVVDTTTMKYTITLTSPGKSTITRTAEQGDASITITPVSEGIWNIQVDAEGTRVIGKGNTGVWVTAGQTASANIKMIITGTRVYSWSNLVADFAELKASNGKLKDLEYIEIAADLTADSGLELKGTTKTIILQAKSNVEIKRNINNSPVFLIEDCTLILDGTQGGTITINGDKENRGINSSRALINVEKNSTLRILNGVTITNNITHSSGINGGGLGGGIYVNNGGTFYMEGGVISNNRADISGGGVHIVNGGTFKKTGGIIYGYVERDNNSNEVRSSGPVTNNMGHAVYYSSSKYSDTTLGENNNWSAP